MALFFRLLPSIRARLRQHQACRSRLAFTSPSSPRVLFSFFFFTLHVSARTGRRGRPSETDGTYNASALGAQVRSPLHPPRLDRSARSPLSPPLRPLCRSASGRAGTFGGRPSLCQDWTIMIVGSRSINGFGRRRHSVLPSRAHRTTSLAWYAVPSTHALYSTPSGGGPGISAPGARQD